MGFPGGSAVKNLPAMQETQEMQVQSLGWEDPLEDGMATHSRISWTEEPGGLQSIGSQRGGHDWSDLAVLTLSASHFTKPKCFYIHNFICLSNLWGVDAGFPVHV